MIADGDLEQNDDHNHRGLNPNQQPDLQQPILKEHRMNEPLEERLNSKDNGHEDVGRFESIHIGEEISGKFPILVVIAHITTYSHQNQDQHEGDGEDLHDSGGRVEAKHHIERSKAQETEILKVALKKQIHNDQGEGIRPQVFTYFVIEETVEGPVVEELHHQKQRHRAADEVH